jgi:phosphatidate cytidylyltransferase
MMASDGSSPGATPPRWVATELGTRVISAVVLGVVALGTASYGGWPFALFWLAAGVAVAVEWITVTGVKPRPVLFGLLGGGLAVLTALLLLQAEWTASLGAAGLILALTLILGRSGRDRAWAAAGFVYAAVIALIPPLVRADPALGLVGLLWMFALVWTTDVAAYFTGRRLGGPKLWPRVSPKKTWSGFIGGVVAGTLAGLVVVSVAGAFGWTAPAGLVEVGIATALASAASQLGDLGESALKRKFSVKDSSHLIPGHGGVMDRVDGFWAVAALVGLGLAGVRLAQGAA